MTGITHDGWYNPWDELTKPEVKALYDEAVATGGFAFRTGYTLLGASRVVVDGDTIRIHREPNTYVDDGIQIVSFGTRVAANPSRLERSLAEEEQE